MWTSRGRRALSTVVVAFSLTAGAVALAPTASAATAPIVVDGMNIDRGGTTVINELEREDIAPGLVHVSYERLGADGWQQIDVLKARLSDDTVKMAYLSPETVAGDGATVTEMVESRGAVAGVNLDRFDINNSTAAAGWGIRDGEIVKSGNPDASASVGMDADGLGALVNLTLEGSAVFEDGSAVPITGVNVSAMPSDGVSLYNARWGSYRRDRALEAGTPAVEVVLNADGVVSAVSDQVGEGQLDEGVQTLVAARTSAAGQRLAALEVGDQLTVSYRIADDALRIQEAGGAWHRLLEDGRPVPYDASQDYFSGVNPRTMIGFSEDRSTAYFVVVDGRTALAAGMNFAEQIRLMQDLGAHDAINADGGGSSQMNVRLPGQTRTSIANSPSDGFERHDGDGMGLVLAKPGSGRLDGFAVSPAMDSDDALRVFPGMRRTLVGHGYDETKSPVDVAPASWSSSDTAAAEVTDGVVAGKRKGAVTVTARTGVAKGTARVDVLGEPTRLTVDQEVVNLEAKGSSAVLTFTGQDDEGFRAPVEAQDLTLTNPQPDVFSVEPTEDGRIKVTATGDEGAATLVFAHGDLRAEVAVAVPLEVRLIDDFSDISGWTTAHDRAPTGGIEPGEGHEGDPSIKLNYDFTESTATRGRYAVAPGAVTGGNGGIEIPGRPQKLSVWIKGDGKGSLLRLQVTQSNGVRSWLDGAADGGSLYATWTGWERKDFVVPASFAFPIKLERIRALETVAAKQYTGSLEFSKIYAYLPPDGITAPHSEPVEDPVVAEAGETDDAPLRVAVVSDAQFVARDPDSGAVDGIRDALREIVAAKPDVMLINGDLVDEASVEDFALAKKILDEELADADFPWYYVPGNHEIMGASIENFRTAFGDTSRVFDVEHTRFITMNSATGQLRSDFAQVKRLREELDDAADDPKVTGVVLVSHMPTNDPLPTKGSQLTDRNEAELVDDWLQDFRAESGKSAAYLAGHVGVFHTETVDGVPYVINGNSGKSPASTPENGGFTGWTMVGIDPAAGEWAGAGEDTPWLQAEVMTRVDSLRVDAPAQPVAVGRSVALNPVASQDDGREVPVAWPSSFRWSGSGGLYVGDPADAPAGAVAAIDPTTQRLTGLRAGTGQATLEINDETATVAYEVTGGDVELSGEPVFGTTASVAVGEWADGGTVRYQWRRDGVPIAGADEASYDLAVDDIGARVDVAVTVTGEDRTPVTVVAALDGAVAAATQEAPQVSIDGEATVGSTVHAVSEGWVDGTALTYQWLRDGTPIPGAVSSGYRLLAADRGATVQVRITGYAQGYEPAVATSVGAGPVTDPVTSPEPEPVPQVVGSATPSVSGAAAVGSLVTARVAGWESGTEFTYQWLRNGAPITGADRAAYRVTVADRGARLSVRVLGAKPGKVAVARTSVATPPVRAGRFGSTPKPRITGVAELGRTLTVRPGRWESGTTLRYRWKRGGKVVRTTSSATYRLRKADLGKRISVTVVATKPGYVTATRTSTATKRVRR